MDFKRIPVTIFAALLLFALAPGALHASIGTFSDWAGYSYSTGPYIDSLNRSFPGTVKPHGYALGIDFWGGSGILQIGFTFGFHSIYQYDKSINAVKVGDQWISNPSQTHRFKLNYQVFYPMLGFRLFLWRNLFVGALVGYHLVFSRPKVDGTSYSQYGDDGICTMVLTGYDFEISRDVFLGLNLRIIMLYRAKHMNTSYVPALTVSFRI